MTERKVQLVVEANAEGVRPTFKGVEQDAREMAAGVTAAGREAGKGVAAIGDGAAPAAEKLDRGTKSIIASIQRTTAAMEAGERGTAKYYEAIAQARGVNVDHLRPYLAQLEEATRKQEEAARCLKPLEMSARETAAAMRTIPMQFTDIAVSLAGGQSPMMVAMQQGGQLKDQFGGVAQAAEAMGSYIVGLVSPVTLAAAAFLALGVAAHQGAQEARDLGNSLTLTGNAAGASVSSLTAMSLAVANATGATRGAAVDAIGQITATGQVSASVMASVSAAAVAMERVGVKSVKDMAEEFATLGKAPAESILKLNEGTNFLTASVYAQIKALQDRGQTEAAADLAQQTYAEAMRGRAEQIKQNLGLLETGWKALGDGAKHAWDKMLNLGREQSLEEKIAAQVKHLQDLRSGLFAVDTSAAEKRLTALQWEKELQDRAARTAAERAEAEKAGIALFQERDKYLSKEVQRRNELARAEENHRKAIAGAGDDAAKVRELDAAYKSAVAGINDKFKDREAESAAKRQEEAYRSLITSIREKVAQEQAGVGATSQLTEAGKLQIKVEQELASGKLKLNAAQRATVDTEIARLFALEQVNLREKQAIEQAKEYAAWIGKQADEETKRAAGLVTGNGKLSEEIALLGLNAREQADYRAEKLRSQAATDLHAAALADEQALLEEAGGVCTAASAAYRDLAVAKRAASAAGYEQARLTQEKAYRSEALREQTDLWKSIEGTAHQTFTSIADGGKDAWTRLKHTGQNIFFDWLYQMTLKRWLFNVAVDVSGQSAAQQAFGMSGNGTAGALNLAGSANNLLSSLNGSPFASSFSKLAATSWGQSALYTPAQGIQSGGMMLDVLDAGSVGQLSELGGTLKAGAEFLDSYGGYINAAYQLSQGRYGASAGAAIGTYFGGPIGSVIGSFAGGMLDSAFGSSGAPKVDVGFGGQITPQGRNYDVSGLDFWNGSKNSEQAANTILTDNLVAALKKVNAGYTGATFLTGHLNMQGRSSNQQLAQVTNSAGNIVYHNFKEEGKGREDFQNFAAAEIPKLQLALMVDAMRGAGGEIKSIADSVVGTAGDLTAALSGMDSAAVAVTTANLSGLAGFFDQLQASIPGMTGEVAVSMAKMAGGAQALVSASAAYSDAVLSDSEKQAMAWSQLERSFTALQMPVARTTSELEKLVDAQDVSTDSGQRMKLSLMALAPALKSLTAAAEQQQQQLQGRIDELTGNTAAIRARELAALDPSNRALQERIYSLEAEATAAQKAAEVANQRAGLQNTLDQMLGNTAAIRARELAALDPSNRALQERIWALEAEATAAQKAAEVASQRAGLQNTLDQMLGNTAAIRARELAALDPSNRALQERIWGLQNEEKIANSAYQVLERSVSAQRTVMQVQRDAAKETVSALSGVFSTLKSGVSDLYGAVESTMAMSSVQGMSFIDRSLENALASGYLPDQGDLADAIQAAREGIDKSIYASQSDQARDRLILAGKLNKLQDIAKAQELKAGEALATADAQMGALDGILENARNQLNAAIGIDNSVKSVKDAVASLHTAITGMSSSLALASQASSAPSPVASRPVISDPADSALVAAAKLVYQSTQNGVPTSSWNDAAAKLGVGPRELTAAVGYTGNPDELRAKYSFDVGTSYVPHDMTADIHKGEIIIDPRSSDVLRRYGISVQGAGNVELIAAFERQTVYIKKLEARLAAIETNTRRTSDTLDSVTEGGAAMRQVAA